MYMEPCYGGWLGCLVVTMCARAAACRWDLRLLTGMGLWVVVCAPHACMAQGTAQAAAWALLEVTGGFTAAHFPVLPDCARTSVCSLYHRLLATVPAAVSVYYGNN